MKIIFSLSLMAALAGCMDDGETADGRDDTFATNGKEDGFAVSKEEASAILRVVNTLSASKLHSAVTLTKVTADSIVKARASAPFETLADLDAVPYVGPVALQKLLAYVHAQNLVAPAAIAGGLDLDGDGERDLIVAASSAPGDDNALGHSDGVPDFSEAGRVYYLPGRGDLTFRPAVQLAIGGDNENLLGEHLAYDRVDNALIASNEVIYLSSVSLTPLVRSHTRVSVQALGDLDNDGHAEHLVSGLHIDHVADINSFEVTIENDALGSYSVYQRIDPPAGVVYWGRTTSAGGDFDGDGRREIVISGFHGDIHDSDKPNSLYVFEQSGATVEATPSVILEGAVNSRAGWEPSMAVLDFDGDGYDDLVTSPWRNMPAPEVRVYRGGPTGLATTPVLLDVPFANATFNNVANDGTPIGVTSIGDVDGDGFADLAVTGPQAKNGETRGAVAIYHGGVSALTNSAAQTFFYPYSTATNWDAFGASVSASTDFDVDGHVDLVIGAPLARTSSGLDGSPTPGRGEVFVYRGTASGFATSPTTTLASPAPDGGWMYGYGSFGYSVL